MKTNIFRFELSNRLRSVLIWSLAAATLSLLFGSFFGLFSEQAELMNSMLSKFPPELRAAFELDGRDFASVLGYFSFLYMFIQLCLAIQAANYGVGLVSVEEAELTADFMLSKPVSRAQVMTSKLLAALAALGITDLLMWGSMIVGILLYRHGGAFNARTLALLLLSIVPFQLFFLCVGLLISLLVKRVRSVTPYGLGLGFGAYMLGAFSGLVGDVKLEWITPFKQLEAAYIVAHNGFNTPLLALCLAIAGVSLATGYALYLRRDIPAVS